jgi:hypothetical protein
MLTPMNCKYVVVVTQRVPGGTHTRGIKPPRNTRVSADALARRLRRGHGVTSAKIQRQCVEGRRYGMPRWTVRPA